MVRSLFGNSNRKLRSTFWGSPFIPVGTNQTECCLPLTNFSVPSRFQTHATQIRPFLDSNRNGCGISTVNWQIAYHYAFATPTGFFCQMVSTPGLCFCLVKFVSTNQKALPRSGQWHVISMESLCLLFRCHFAGKSVVASRNVWLFSQAKLEC